MKIMIIGNGFDLNLGLKTSYNDFINSKYFSSLLMNGNSLAEYLRVRDSSDLNKWVDIEKELTNYSRNTEVSNVKLKKDFIDLKSALIEYLSEVEADKINDNSKAFKMIEQEILTTDIIYNFNYTNSVFRVAKELGLDKNIDDKHVYVHGSIYNNDIIFGVEDRAKVIEEHIFFKKSYNLNFGKSNISKYLNNKNDLVLFGHSLGITDSAYFKDYILRLTNNNSRSVELKFYYYGEIGYDEMMQSIDLYSLNNLTDFKNKNIFIAIDSTNPT